MGARRETGGFRGQRVGRSCATRQGRRVRLGFGTLLTRRHYWRPFGHHQLHRQNTGVPGEQTGCAASRARGSGRGGTGFRVRGACRPSSDAVHRGRGLRVPAPDRLADRAAHGQ